MVVFAPEANTTGMDATDHIVLENETQELIHTIVDKIVQESKQVLKILQMLEL